MFLAIVLMLWGVSPPAESAHAVSTGEVWWLTDNPDGSAAEGARMAATEMERTATLLRKPFALREHHVSQVDAGPALLRAAAAAGATSVVMDLPWAFVCEAARAARAEAILPIAVRPADAPCDVVILQVRLPQEERRALLADHIPASGSEALRVDEWHPSLTRFGAGELNERFERHADRLVLYGHDSPRQLEMDADAWAGWFGVKVAAEAAFRGIGSLAELTAPDGLRFDGHKGVALQFDRTGILRQPVFIIDGTALGRPAVIAEIP